jgi:riboflavin kinase/FMN adenylyltransferase
MASQSGVIALKRGGKAPQYRNLTLLLGTFDGVHLGHRELIKRAKLEADGPIGVLLFSEPPSKVLLLGKPCEVLTSLEDKTRIFLNEGVDLVFTIESDRMFFSMGKEDFIENVLAPLNPKRLIVGEDYTFGRNAEGKPGDLEGRFEVIEVPLLEMNGRKVSSSYIKKLIADGDIKEANAELGRPYEIVGKVVHGLSNGHKIGFPTANLSLIDDYVLPRTGAYKGLVYSRGRPYWAIVNVGRNPTVGKLREDIVECHLKGFSEEIYGETLYVEFHEFLRPEKKFGSLDALKRQLQEDIASLD